MFKKGNGTGELKEPFNQGESSAITTCHGGEGSNRSAGGEKGGKRTKKIHDLPERLEKEKNGDPKGVVP